MRKAQSKKAAAAAAAPLGEGQEEKDEQENEDGNDEAPPAKKQKSAAGAAAAGVPRGSIEFQKNEPARLRRGDGYVAVAAARKAAAQHKAAAAAAAAAAQHKAAAGTSTENLDERTWTEAEAAVAAAAAAAAGDEEDEEEDVDGAEEEEDNGEASPAPKAWTETQFAREVARMEGKPGDRGKQKGRNKARRGVGKRGVTRGKPTSGVCGRTKTSRAKEGVAMMCDLHQELGGLSIETLKIQVRARPLTPARILFSHPSWPVRAHLAVQVHALATMGGTMGRGTRTHNPSLPTMGPRHEPLDILLLDAAGQPAHLPAVTRARD